MTRPLPAHNGPRSRISLACLPCRRAKVKCDGKAPMQPTTRYDVGPKPSSEPCTRCLKNGSECTWLPSRRIGSKRRLAEESSGDASSQREDSHLTETSAPAEDVSDASSQPFVTPPSLLVRSSQEFQTTLSELLSPSEITSPLSFLDPTMHLSDHEMQDFFTVVGSAPSVDIIPPNEVQEIISLYYTHVHHFCYILPPYSIFIASSPPASLVILSAMGALVSPFAPVLPSTDYATLTTTLLSTDTTTPLLQHIQALIMLVHVEYGSGTIDIARERLATAVRLAVSSSMHQRDLVQAGGSSADAEAERRVWWELWTLDGMLQVVSGLHRSVLGGISAAVNLPYTWLSSGPEQQPSAFALRARTISLLLAVSSPATTELSQAVQEERARAIMTALANILVLSRESYDCCSAREMNTEGEDAVKWRANREAAFMALMMNYAAMIHLYHQHNNVLLQLTRDLDACSLSSSPYPINSPLAPTPPMVDFDFGVLTPLAPNFEFRQMTTPPPVAAALLSRVPASHVAASVAAAQSIMAIVREDYEHQRLRSLAVSTSGSSRTNIGTSSPSSRSSPGIPSIPCPTNRHRPSHSPFFACSQVISAYGLLLGLVSNGEEVSSWRDLELRSDLEMVEETLRRQATVWRVAGELYAKVRRFRAQIQGTSSYPA